MKKGLFLFFFLLGMSVGMSAQENPSAAGDNPFAKLKTYTPGQGQISIRQSHAIEQMMLVHLRVNQNTPGVEGFRIQLYSGTGARARQEAQNLRARFLTIFPGEKITIEYKAPFWNVRVGYYRHKHEALPLLKKVRVDFPGSYAVRDIAIKPENFN